MTKIQYEDIKLSLFTNLCNATGIYRRTLNSANKEAFKKNAAIIIKELIVHIDSNTIKNETIREAIKKLAEISGFGNRIGVSQKVINVYLKYYCAVANKNREIMTELDCPIDSLVIKDNKIPKISLKDMTYENYINTQELLEERHKIRVMADVPSYDKRKLY